MSLMNVQLNTTQLTDLRERGLILADEIAFLAGDLLIAENPVTSNRRVVGSASLLTESTNKRVLKG